MKFFWGGREGEREGEGGISVVGSTFVAKAFACNGGLDILFIEINSPLKLFRECTAANSH